MAKNASEVASAIKKGSSALNLGKGKKQAAAEAPTQPDGEAQFSPALEKLIAMAVADGEITDDEMTLLRRKAEKEGVDPDEMEFIVRRRIRRVVSAASHEPDIEKESKVKEKDSDEPEQPRNASRSRRDPIIDDDDFDDDDDIDIDDDDIDDDDENLTEGIMNSLKGKLGGIVDEIMG